MMELSHRVGGEGHLFRLDELHPKVGQEDPQLGVAPLVQGVQPGRHDGGGGGGVGGGCCGGGGGVQLLAALLGVCRKATLVDFLDRSHTRAGHF